MWQACAALFGCMSGSKLSGGAECSLLVPTFNPTRHHIQTSTKQDSKNKFTMTINMTKAAINNKIWWKRTWYYWRTMVGTTSSPPQVFAANDLLHFHFSTMVHQAALRTKRFPGVNNTSAGSNGNTNKKMERATTAALQQYFYMTHQIQIIMIAIGLGSSNIIQIQYQRPSTAAAAAVCKYNNQPFQGSKHRHRTNIHINTTSSGCSAIPLINSMAPSKSIYPPSPTTATTPTVASTSEIILEQHCIKFDCRL